MLRIYLDNCCFNRPYDDQSQFRVALETQCKLRVQDRIKAGELTLVASYMLRYECAANPHIMRRETIEAFIRQYAGFYVGVERQAEIEEKAREIMRTGVKFKDACHVASAIFAKCDYLISTDKRLLKFRTDEINMVTPVEFILRTEGEEYVGDKR